MAKVPINVNALKWAIKSSGIPEGDVDSYLDFAPGTIDDWIKGYEKPNQTEFKKLASKLKRPTAVFFMENPPRTVESKVEFRSAFGDVKRTMPPKARESIRDAIRIQRFISGLIDELGIDVREYPTNSTNEDADQVADQIRASYFDVPVELQMSWSSDTSAFKEWRKLVEKLGILVFLYPMGKNPDEDKQDSEFDCVNSVKGFSHASVYPPVIGINTHWNPSVRTYTLFHEFGHILTRTSSACTEVSSKHTVLGEYQSQLERWCEKFSAAFLMPRQDFLKIYERFKHDDKNRLAGSIARQFSVSRKAALLRLIQIGKADWGDYRKLEAIYDRNPKAMKYDPDKTPVRTRDVRIKDQYGNCLSIVRKAFREGVIDEIDILDYFNLSSDKLR